MSIYITTLKIESVTGETMHFAGPEILASSFENAEKALKDHPVSEFFFSRVEGKLV